MVNESLRLRLSANDLRLLVPDWPDALVNDYIEIFSELEQVIIDLNKALQDIGTLFNDYNNINSDLSGVRGSVASIKAKVLRFTKLVDSLLPLVQALEIEISNIKQELAIAELPRLRAKLNNAIKNYMAWLPAKSALLTIEGNGASNPTLTNSYNVASVTRTGVGVYQVTVLQDTYFTNNLLAKTVFSFSKTIMPLTQSYDVEVVVTSSTTFEIRAYQLSVVLTAIDRSAYDLVSGDFVSVQGLYSINSNLPPR